MNKIFLSEMHPSYSEENSQFFQENIADFKVLIVTATDTERQALHQHLKPIEGRDSLIQVAIGKQTYFLGVFGSYNAVHVACGDMGSTGRNASIITTVDAISVCHPSIVLMVGIAFGKDKKQQIGDVLVAERIIPYEPQRVGEDEVISRGKEGPASSLLVNRFRNANSWHYSLTKGNANIIIGDVLTGEKLVDDPEFKKELLKRYPNVKGGEMEGAGIYAACDGHNLEWILVKGICDYADGNKKNKKKLLQGIAIESAISLCEHIFNGKHTFESIGVYSVENAKKKDSTANLRKQVDRQLKKQINSEKYVRSTFIETGSQKDRVRYLCDSIFYSRKCFNEIVNLDFRHLNTVLKRRGKNQFEWNTSLLDVAAPLTTQNYYAALSNWHQYLTDKKAEISALGLSSYDTYKFQSKLAHKLEDIEYLQARVAIITDNAGQGKTNFLCDFVENFLINRNSPTLFLTGTEINTSDIRKSILQKVFPDTEDISFKYFLDSIELVCRTQNKFFIIVIDGLNENLQPKELSQKLEEFISELLEYNFIKFVLTCRSEYYEHNFINLENSSFRKATKKITSLIDHRLNKDIENKLIETYFDNYDIKYTNLYEKAREQLVGNFLILKIFCETYKGQTYANIDNIYKEELFHKYYVMKSEEINKRLKQTDEFRVSVGFDIRNFIKSVITFMINEKVYANIPLDDIISSPKDSDLYTRFLDENILIRRDIDKKDNGIFGPSEVVNFTFDEFRDFLISNYLVDTLYKKSEADFCEFLEKSLDKKSPLLEGCSTFLFFIARRRDDSKLNEIISKQVWFDDTFSKNIFSLQDNLVSAEDKEKLTKQLLNGLGICESIIFNLIIRNDDKYYKQLNSDFLFSFLRELNEEQYYKSFIKHFGNRSYLFSTIDQSSLIEQISKLLKRIELDGNQRYHKLFELLIYMFLNDNNWQARDLYGKYSYKYKSQANAQLNDALKSKNPSLIKSIHLFARSHEIKL